MMDRVWQVARREFSATVETRAFVIGLLVVPLVIAPMALILPRLFVGREARDVVGEVAILDPTGQVAARARERLSREVLAERRMRMQAAMDSIMPSPTRLVTGAGGTEDAAGRGIDEALEDAPDLTLTELSADVDLEQEKAALLDGSGPARSRLALFVIHPDAVSAERAEDLGSYDLYVREELDWRVTSELQSAVEGALVDARLAHRALDADEIRWLTWVGDVGARTAEPSGDSEASSPFAGMLIPMAFMFLMFTAIMTSGSRLLTSTIEEKSSRVVELLLAAVSPTELMAGKIFGQLGVGLLMLALYGGLGILGLVSFSALGLLHPMLLVYLLVFFLIGFAMMASFMAAIGAAVSDVHDAQALLAPVTIVSVLPMMLWMPISQDPNSTLATVLSIVPPVSPFAMILRLASNTPPPAWQVALSLVLGVAAAAGAVQFAGKAFRVALLIHGKPPNLVTLVRWVRAG